MDTLNAIATSDLSLWGLFVSSFLAATLLPGGSEAVLYGVLKLHPELFWPALLLGSLGNTLGGMVTFGMGWMLPQRKGGGEAAGNPQTYPAPEQMQQLKHVKKVQLRRGGAKHSGAGEAASHPLTQTNSFEKNVLRVRRYGTPALTLAWVPLIGDALCLAAGWLRLCWWQAALFMAAGKFARYWVVAIAVLG